MGICRQYFATSKNFEKKYGINTVVLIQIGKFYEIYGYDPSRSGQSFIDEANNVAMRLSMKLEKTSIEINEILDENLPQGHALEMSCILNMKLTSKNKEKPHSLDNPMMTGFPCPVYENYRDLILAHGYTIVRIDQKNKLGDGEDVEREVVEIVSPGTEISNSLNQGNTIVSIYIECFKMMRNFENATLLCGISSLDASTGSNTVYEVYSKNEDKIYALQEIYRFLTIHKPVEVILHLNKIPSELKDAYTSFILDTLELDRYPMRIVKVNELDPVFKTDVYQEEVLRKAFHSLKPELRPIIIQQGTSKLIFELDLERKEYGCLSYIVLLNYCYEHNESIISRLSKPRVGYTDEEKHLVLTHNATLQLDIFPKTNVGYLEMFRKRRTLDSLVSVLDNTSTPLGSRFLRKQLLTPITDIAQLETYYSLTQGLIENEELLSQLELLLRKLGDMEKHQRKLCIGVIKPREFVLLFRSYVFANSVLTLLSNSTLEKEHLDKVILKPDEVSDFQDCLKEVLTVINLDKLEKVRYTSKIGGRQERIQSEDSFFLHGYDSETDQIMDKLSKYQNWLTQICDYLNSLLPPRGKKIEPSYERMTTKKDIEENDGLEEGELTVTLSTTPAKVTTLKMSQPNQDLCGRLEFTEMNKSKVLITSNLISECCTGISNFQSNLEDRLLLKFKEVVAKIAERRFFNRLTYFLALVDFLKCNAQNALRYRYFRPKIDKEASSSYISVSGLRHPLIERIIRSEYIPNDISLGINEMGMLLFGVNSSGKSSLAKSMGCVLIMAQAGMFCPGNVVYHPFSKIITRLSGEDDLLKGQSSFIVEMSELRTILRNADNRTLVLGDELCRGTESRSGTSLTVATLSTLVERKTKFIFSTHMHNLTKMKRINEMMSNRNLRVAHLEAFYDENLERLVYNRKLGDGAGTSHYGLEVCRSLGIDPEFIDLANTIAREMDELPERLVGEKKSRYNRKVFVDECSLCKSRLNLHTHHLEEQQSADERGFIEHYHKNSSFNLLVLCQTCHEKIHSSEVKIEKKQSLNGTVIKILP